MWSMMNIRSLTFVNSLTNRWSTIQVTTNKFCGCLFQIDARHSSGVTEQDKVYMDKLLQLKVNKSID